MELRQADWISFIGRYRQLSKLWFSPRVQPQYDEDGEELPQAVSITNLTDMFKNMGLIPPSGRTEKPRFMNPDAQKGFEAWLKQYEAENSIKLF